MKTKTNDLEKSIKLIHMTKTDKRRKIIQIANTRNERQTISRNASDIERQIREDYKQLYLKFENLHVKDKSLENHKLWKLIQDEIENLNIPVTIKDTEIIFYKPSKK